MLTSGDRTVLVLFVLGCVWDRLGTGHFCGPPRCYRAPSSKTMADVLVGICLQILSAVDVVHRVSQQKEDQCGRNRDEQADLHNGGDILPCFL